VPRCPNNCNNGNGRCNPKTGACTCKPDWTGDDCSVPACNKQCQHECKYLLVFSQEKFLLQFLTLKLNFRLSSRISRSNRYPIRILRFMMNRSIQSLHEVAAFPLLLIRAQPGTRTCLINPGIY